MNWGGLVTEVLLLVIGYLFYVILTSRKTIRLLKELVNSQEELIKEYTKTQGLFRMTVDALTLEVEKALKEADQWKAKVPVVCPICKGFVPFKTRHCKKCAKKKETS